MKLFYAAGVIPFLYCLNASAAPSDQQVRNLALALQHNYLSGLSSAEHSIILDNEISMALSAYAANEISNEIVLNTGNNPDAILETIGGGLVPSTNDNVLPHNPEIAECLCGAMLDPHVDEIASDNIGLNPVDPIDLYEDHQPLNPVDPIDLSENQDQGGFWAGPRGDSVNPAFTEDGVRLNW